MNVFISIAHDGETSVSDEKLKVLCSDISKRLSLLSDGQIRVFFDAQISGFDPDINSRVKQELEKTDVCIVLLWQRYFNRLVDKDKFNVIRDTEYPWVASHMDKTVVFAYGRLDGLRSLRERFFGQKLICAQERPFLRCNNRDQKELFVAQVADEVMKAFNAK
ncbi:MAG: hypothetical protein ACRCV6_05910 [Formosimonas sp.]